MSNSAIIGTAPSGITTVRLSSGMLLHVGPRMVARGRSPALSLPGLKRWLALRMDGLYWMAPTMGEELSAVPTQTQFLLWERTDRSYGVLLPLVDGDLRAWLRGTSAGIVVECDGALKGARTARARLAFVMQGKEPYQLVHDAMAVVAEHTGTFRLREQKPVPAYAELLGWCTWDAFYHNVDASKVLAGLRSFAKGGVRPGFMILDDGWEQRDADFLSSFEPDRRKFPGGFKPLIEKAKRQFGVRIFGIHHPFQGYWAGVDPKSALGKRYRTIANHGCIRPWVGPGKDKLCLVHPHDAYRFYHEFYAYLREQGADMVKVDGMSALHLFSEGTLGRVSTMCAYQQAQQGAAAVNFQSQTIPCMSNGSDVLYHLNASNGWRNSTDYFPGRPPHVHKWHVYVNAMNNVWSSTFALPDWDMFQSHQPEAAFHAAARAISGGPVYVCDKPGKQNFALLATLCTSEGRLLRCARPARVARDCLFVDTYRVARPLKVTNVNGKHGVLGLFHVTRGAEWVEGTYCAADVDGMKADRYAAYHYRTEMVRQVKPRDRMTIAFEPMGWELVTFAPVLGAFAPIGLLDKLNSSRALQWQSAERDGGLKCRVTDGGRFGCWCKRRPKAVTVDGKRTPFTYRLADGLLTVTLPLGRASIVHIQAGRK